ncbi:MAG: hypothetical protein ACK45D_00560 [Alphaproteobacteria bacterium]|jgi:hypothetical protein
MKLSEVTLACGTKLSSLSPSDPLFYIDKDEVRKITFWDIITQPSGDWMISHATTTRYAMSRLYSTAASAWAVLAAEKQRELRALCIKAQPVGTPQKYYIGLAHAECANWICDIFTAGDKCVASARASNKDAATFRAACIASALNTTNADL